MVVSRSAGVWSLALLLGLIHAQGSHDGYGQAFGLLLRRRRAQAFIRADQQVPGKRSD